MYKILIGVFLSDIFSSILKVLLICKFPKSNLSQKTPKWLTCACPKIYQNGYVVPVPKHTKTYHPQNHVSIFHLTKRCFPYKMKGIA